MNEVLYQKTLVALSGSMGETDHPVLDILLKPWGDEHYHIRHVDIVMGLESPRTKAGQALVSLWVNVASIPCSEMTAEGLNAWDGAGALPLDVIVETDAMGFEIRRWLPKRDTVGHVALTYRFLPRVVPPRLQIQALL